MSTKPKTIPGTAKILAVEYIPPKILRWRRYDIVHVPSDTIICTLENRDDAVTVAKELFAKVPLEQWQTVNRDTLREIVEPLGDWLIPRLRELYKSREARR